MAEYTYNPLVTDETVGTPIEPAPMPTRPNPTAKMTLCKCKQAGGGKCTCTAENCGCLGCPKNASTKVKLSELPEMDYFKTEDGSERTKQWLTSVDNNVPMDGTADEIEKCDCIEKACDCVDACDCDNGEGMLSRTGSLKLKAKNQLEKVQVHLDKVQKAIGVKKLTDQEKEAKAMKKAEMAERNNGVTRNTEEK
jgi:hypothetical protein